MANFYTIPLGYCFLKELAHFLINQYPNDLARAKVHVWLPTNRSVMGLKECFYHISREAKMNCMLPEMYSLTDIESKNPMALSDIYDLPKAISSFEYLSLVMDLLPSTLHVKKAGAIAEYLISLYDECVISGVDFDYLATYLSEKESHDTPLHIKESLTYIKILTDNLPRALQKRSVVTQAYRRKCAMEILSAHLEKNHPAHPIVIAGTTGTVPTTRMLLKSIAQMENGVIVLPGLDPACDFDRVTQMISHHQYTLFDLCTYLDLKPAAVQLIKPAQNSMSQARHDLIARMSEKPPFVSTEITNQDNIKNLPTYIECATYAEEAKLIVAIAREKLHNSSDKISIVTPNLMLMNRIRAEFSLHKIYLNESAGVPFHETPVGTFIAAFLTFLKQPSSATFIHFSKHPLCYKLMRGVHLHRVRCLEIALRKDQKEWCHEPDDYIQRLQMILLEIGQATSFVSFVGLLKKYLTELSDGYVFKDTDGAVAEILFADIFAYTPFVSRDYVDAFGVLMRFSGAVHKQAGTSSRVHLLGTLEARLNATDVVICASLNEDDWPKTPSTDIMLSKSIRQKIGLPDEKRRQCLAAHDFYSSFYAKDLYITRSMRADTEMTHESRLWTRLKSVLPQCIERQNYYKLLAQYMPDSDAQKVLPPTPHPAFANRPITYYATQIDTLIKDPYAFYMRHVLKLNPLPMLDEKISAKEKGQLFHNVLDQYLKQETQPTREKLETFAKPYFAQFKNRGGAVSETFWWHRFQTIADWWHAELDATPVNMRLTETTGEAVLPIADTYVVLKSRADRVEVTQENDCLRIIDYKTGTLPTRSEIYAGKATQLIVESIIAHHKGFSLPYNQDMPFMLSYWRLVGGETGCETLSIEFDAEMRQTQQLHLTNLFQHYYVNAEPYLASCRYAETAIFAREEEWGSG